ncbi:anti-sigma regulatory factor (Ser/Thr protein kinase) [Terriglobus roseus DSM 18391]|uniref:Anti-sigma regulatory factor (Ser/Thr protein kinase) n=1 Tax=Terriglobus roseus (strain DSM 18391 / NRRL B-41598 / KBS 63) TaxID=926566 RepID=I3ZIF1_TERRK|nr:anti-sigma regulatory factor (Ser/Thr protein kinase) [Terriglobus roseus DSM 18391]
MFLDFPRRGKHTAREDRTFAQPLYRRPLPNTPTTRTSLTLASTLETVDRVEHEAESFAARFGFNEDDVSSIAMAVREATVNAVIHGNAYSQDKQVTASFEATENELVFRISDQGTGFNEESIPDPLSPENILRGSGRGVFLMKAFMDEVHFRQLSPGTELTLIKHRTPEQHAA